MSGYLAADDAAALVRQALLQIPSVRKNILSLNLGRESIERLNILETNLGSFRSGANPSHFTEIPRSEIAAYQKIFQLLAAASPSPHAARELMSAILAKASHIKHPAD